MLNKKMIMPFVWGLTVAILGGLATDLGPWYQALKEPFWKPPDAAFGPIWSTIFILSGMAWYGAKHFTSDPAVLSRLNILFWLNYKFTKSVLNTIFCYFALANLSS